MHLERLHRLQAGAVLGDSAMLAAARAEFDSTGDVTLLLQDAQLFGLALQEAERGAAVYLKRSTSGPNRPWQGHPYFPLLSSVGSARRGRCCARSVGSTEAMPTMGVREDHRLTRCTGRRSPRPPRRPWPASRHPPMARWRGTLRRESEQYQGICFVQWWRLAHGDTRTARAAIARLAGGKALGCGVMLEALLARRGAPSRCRRRVWPAGHAPPRRRGSCHLGHGGCTVARGPGDVGGALRATRRRANHTRVEPVVLPTGGRPPCGARGGPRRARSRRTAITSRCATSLSPPSNPRWTGCGRSWRGWWVNRDEG